MVEPFVVHPEEQKIYTEHKYNKYKQVSALLYFSTVYVM